MPNSKARPVRERIIAAELKKLERRQASQMAAKPAVKRQVPPKPR